jgi:hypothetical protein
VAPFICPTFNSHEGKDGRGNSRRGSIEIDGERKFLHILSHVRDDGHNVVRKHEEIVVERVDIALLSLSILARVEDAT